MSTRVWILELHFETIVVFFKWPKMPKLMRTYLAYIEGWQLIIVGGRYFSPFFHAPLTIVRKKFPPFRPRSQL